MQKDRPRVLLLCTLFTLALCTLVHSCSSSVDPNYRRYVQDPPLNPVRPDELAATDRFEIRVSGEPDLSGEFTVSSAGTITFPWIGEIQVDSTTCSEVTETIRAALADGYLLNPSVTCQIVEINSRRVDIIGEVNRPGSLIWRSGMSVLSAIGEAQGFTADAAQNDTAVLRTESNVEMRIVMPMDDILAGVEPNFPLQPGDTIVVPRYVLLP